MCCSFEHLGVNLLIQILIGSLSEMVFKWWGCLLIYLCGVFAGSVTTSIVYSQIGLEGASAGISSLLTAYIGFKIMVLIFIYNEFHNFCLAMFLIYH